MLFFPVLGKPKQFFLKIHYHAFDRRDKKLVLILVFVSQLPVQFYIKL